MIRCELDGTIYRTDMQLIQAAYLPAVTVCDQRMIEFFLPSGEPIPPEPTGPGNFVFSEATNSQYLLLI